MQKLHLYSASAGAGKTYRLTEEYLKLVFKHPQNYKRVLAVTFTNKATEEMKDRIIAALADLSKGDQGGHFEALRSHTNFSDEQIADQAKEILTNILHDYSRFAVSTIDSFFQRILKGFVKELGVHGGFNIELDQEAVLEEVSKSIIDEMGQQEDLKQWLMDYVKDNIDQGKSWNIQGTLKDLGKEVLAEQFKLIESKGFGASKDIQSIKDYLSLLKGQNETFEQDLASIGKKALELLKQNDLVVADFSYGKSGFANYFQKLVDGDIVAPSNRVLQAVDNVDKWASKKSEKKHAIKAIYFNGLNDLLQEAIAQYYGEIHLYNTNTAILKSIYVYGVYFQIIQQLRKYREENNLLLMADVSALLNDIIGQNNAPYVYEKVGAFYKHFLIDEFQDTSRLQWLNFKPLLQNGLGEGKGSLIVGDVKQAIYRWRGGDWKLLLEDVEKDVGDEWIQRESLQHNWRSTQEVIRFNNTLFHASPKILEGYFRNELDNAKENAFSSVWEKQYAFIHDYFASKVSKAYDDAFQKFPGKHQGRGAVKLKFWEVNKEEQFSDFASQQLKLHLDELIDKGSKLSDIAILVRSKRESKWASDQLQRYSQLGERKYHAIVSGALRYESNSAVRLIIKALRYLNDPLDRINTYELLRLWYQQSGQFFDQKAVQELAQWDSEVYLKLLPEDFVQNVAKLAKMPIYELIQELAECFDLAKNEKHWSFLEAFNDVVVYYTRSKSAELGAFLSFWDDKGKDLSPTLSAAQDAIQIQTIHKSKGLQYKHVIVPFCNWAFHHNPRFTNMIWGYSEQEPYSEFPYFPIDYKKDLQRSMYAMHYFDEMLQVLMENLNILYVALTRAEETIFCIGEKGKKKDKISSLNASDVLLDLMQFDTSNASDLLDSKQYWDDENGVFEYNEIAQELNIHENKEYSDNQRVRYGNLNYRSRLSIRKKSERFFEQLQYPIIAEKINYGVLMHELFSKIKYEDDIDTAIHELWKEGRIDSEQKDKVKEKINRIINLPEVKPWFDNSWQVKNEQLIIDPNHKYDKRPDRVIVRENEAIIVDYKFGDEHDDKYVAQIRNYIQLMQSMGYSKVSGFLLYGEEEKVEEVSINKDKSGQINLF